MTGAARRLEQARARIAALDAALIDLVAQRLAAAAEAGRAKSDLGQPTMDFARERSVLDAARVQAAAHGVPPDLAEDLVARLVVASTARQDGERILHQAAGRGKTAVVVGGAGRMGSWFVSFLRDAGYSVTVQDPRRPGSMTATPPDADLILLAVPPSIAAQLYATWKQRPPSGLVVEVCSIKAPLIAALREFAAAGGRVASLHPLFGPTIQSLRGADVLLCNIGRSEDQAAMRALFAATSARILEVDLDQHDVAMADVLALSHATALAFAASLDAPPAMHSTTFQRLAAVARGVVAESPQVYFEIQAGNPAAAASVQRLADAVARLQAVIASRDAAAFASYMQDGARRLGGPR